MALSLLHPIRFLGSNRLEKETHTEKERATSCSSYRHPRDQPLGTAPLEDTDKYSRPRSTHKHQDTPNIKLPFTLGSWQGSIPTVPDFTPALAKIPCRITSTWMQVQRDKHRSHSPTVVDRTSPVLTHSTVHGAGCSLCSSPYPYSVAPKPKPAWPCHSEAFHRCPRYIGAPIPSPPTLPRL